MCVPGAGRSGVVAQLLHVFGHDVEGDGDEALGANPRHCRTNVFTNKVILVISYKLGEKQQAGTDGQTFSAFTLSHNFRVCVFRPPSQKPAK